MTEFVPHIVIGSGPGGATTAYHLSRNGREVLVLEEGESVSVEPFTPEEMLRTYRSGGITATVGKPLVQYVEGCTVGGGSEINSGLYHRTPEEILQFWKREFGLVQTDWEPVFRQIEKDLSVSLMAHTPPKASLKLKEGAEALGWSAQEIPRWHKYGNTGTGERQTMSKTYLKWALESGRCRLESKRRVVSIGRHGSHWRVLSVCGKEWETDHLFLCCGAIYTPFLLQRSGLNKGVGRTLSLHPTVKLTALFDEEVNDDTMGVCVHQVKEFAPQMSFGCSISKPGHLALAGLDQPDLLRRVDFQWKQMAVYYVNVLGTSHGRVRTVPASPDPVVSYRVTDRELGELAVGLKRLARLLFAAGAQRLYPSITGQNPLKGPSGVESLPEILPAERSRLMTVHLFGSCAAGERDICPVDSFGNLKGYPGLHIHDAAVLCSAPGVNPQGTVMALAYRSTLDFLERTA